MHLKLPCRDTDTDTELWIYLNAEAADSLLSLINNFKNYFINNKGFVLFQRKEKEWSQIKGNPLNEISLAFGETPLYQLYFGEHRLPVG